VAVADPLDRVATAAQARAEAAAEWEAAIVAAVLARLPIRRIAAAAGVTHTAVKGIAARHGVRIQGHPPTGYRIITRPAAEEEGGASMSRPDLSGGAYPVGEPAPNRPGRPRKKGERA